MPRTLVLVKKGTAAVKIMEEIPWILASSSSRRQQLLQEIGLHFICVPANVEEYKKAGEGQTPRWVVQENAYLKAQHVASLYPKHYVIGSDTIVVFQQSIFNKPKDMAEAQHMLEQLSGNTHQVLTAVAIICQSKHKEEIFVESTDVTFDTLSPDFIKKYLATISPLDKAGAYAIQHPLTQTFAHFDKRGFSNIMGFPTEAFKEHVKSLLK